MATEMDFHLKSTRNVFTLNGIRDCENMSTELFTEASDIRDRLDQTKCSTVTEKHMKNACRGESIADRSKQSDSLRRASHISSSPYPDSLEWPLNSLPRDLLSSAYFSELYQKQWELFRMKEMEISLQKSTTSHLPLFWNFKAPFVDPSPTGMDWLVQEYWKYMSSYPGLSLLPAANGPIFKYEDPVKSSTNNRPVTILDKNIKFSSDVFKTRTNINTIGESVITQGVSSFLDTGLQSDSGLRAARSFGHLVSNTLNSKTHSGQQQQLGSGATFLATEDDCSSDIENSARRDAGMLAGEHSTGPPRYPCQSCGRIYATITGLRRHRELHCVAAAKQHYTCPHCTEAARSYTSRGALRMHMRTHTLPCQCRVCGKSFSRPWLLQGHMRTHTGERPFACPQCGRAFADRSNLRAHAQTHADVKRYVCSKCSRSFSRMSLLTKHARCHKPCDTAQ